MMLVHDENILPSLPELEQPLSELRCEKQKLGVMNDTCNKKKKHRHILIVDIILHRKI